MSTPEGLVKNRVKSVLTKYTGDVYVHMPVLNGMGTPSLDFIGCFNSKFFAIETKAFGKKPTMMQLATIEKMRSAGAEVFVIDGDTSELEAWFFKNRF